MPHPDLLELVRIQTEQLVGEQLRSVSQVIGHLLPVIAAAHARGHSHAAIHARLMAGGLQVSWRNYRACLVRSRRRAAAQQDLRPNGSVALSIAPASVPKALVATERVASSLPSPTQVRDALRGAQQVASRDYAHVARALHRKKPSP